MTTKAPLVVIVGGGFGGLAAAKGLRGARLIIRRRANDGEAVLAKDNRWNFTMAIEKAVYTAHARATGGRVGTAKSDDGQIDLKLDRPIEMGGKGNGTNPEQLFAAGYAACFIGALRVVASKRHIRVPEEVAIDSAVSFGPLAGGAEGFGIAVAMTIHLPGIEKATAEELVYLAHQTCPYSNATRGNIDVLLTVA